MGSEWNVLTVASLKNDDILNFMVTNVGFSKEYARRGSDANFDACITIPTIPHRARTVSCISGII